MESSGHEYGLDRDKQQCWVGGLECADEPGLRQGRRDDLLSLSVLGVCGCNCDCIFLNTRCRGCDCNNRLILGGGGGFDQEHGRMQQREQFTISLSDKGVERRVVDVERQYTWVKGLKRVGGVSCLAQGGHGFD